jgi:hypothetical protein
MRGAWARRRRRTQGRSVGARRQRSRGCYARIDLCASTLDSARRRRGQGWGLRRQPEAATAVSATVESRRRCSSPIHGRPRRPTLPRVKGAAAPSRSRGGEGRMACSLSLSLSLSLLVAWSRPQHWRMARHSSADCTCDSLPLLEPVGRSGKRKTLCKEGKRQFAFPKCILLLDSVLGRVW